jgi:hypothetical protein
MKSSKDVSRRKFLQSAAGAGVVAGLATVAIPLSASAAAGPVNVPAPPRSEHPLETILSRYGSELGHLKQTR